jgi:hypothetical protein
MYTISYKLSNIHEIAKELTVLIIANSFLYYYSYYISSFKESLPTDLLQEVLERIILSIE